MTAVVALLGSASSACRRSAGTLAPDDTRPTLRVGVGGFTAIGNEGLRALAQNFVVENLARLSDDGRPQPWLAHDWNLSPDGLSLTMNLVSGVKFHDGSPLSADIVVNALKVTLPSTMGPAFSDVESIAATTDRQIVIRLHQPSPFLLDALEVPIPKPGATLVGTGSFIVDSPQSPTQMHANDGYYLGRPSLARIVVTNYPSVRAAWAEMLRGRIDMLYEVGADALDSLEASSQIATFTFVRRYQYAIVLNAQSEALRSKSVRRGLNMAVDRSGLVDEALNKRGIVSNGPVWLHHYAFRSDLPRFAFDTTQASQLLRAGGRGAKKLQFTCLIRPDAPSERIALVLKKQLQAVGVELVIEEVPSDKLLSRVRGGTYEAALLEVISGPTMLRPYQLWHSKGFLNVDSPAIDAALDQVRYSTSTESYQQGVGGFQQAMMDDPPAIFLAWMERARAVSKQFDVPPVESGRDILASLRQWKSSARATQASRN
ncbi:MAG: hypothetical protein JWL71_2662 [Acidobacteria bacterium]|nr:hypothetical protein [Acidobacteriota bacterium]